LSEARGKNVAHNAFVDLIGVQPTPLHCLAHNDSAELRRTQIGETALESSYRSTTTGNDDNIIESRH
jgi:hypothetical protein